ncbi:CHAT domain-containing protein [Streptomyces sp. TRM43335]|uniref:CHAT domain-containing protein n=1 Tax=Streptomyces taklimakanensis TaxID=2569853 RepID=A0A6G2B6D1_9ACTN|nr:CHAT domain-containing protein [Streptomyces taklimakanensis]MTE17629.1 CHAT domain-containing protein [Streptomyces taklimakanensis]
MSYSVSWNSDDRSRWSGHGGHRPFRQSERPPERRRPDRRTAATALIARELFRRGMAEHARFKDTGESRHLDTCIALLGRAVSRSLPGDPTLIASSNNLGVALFDRYKLGQRGAGAGPDPGDLDQALEHLLRAYRSSPPGSPTRARATSTLFDAYQARLARSEPLSGELERRLPSFKSLRREVSRTPGIAVQVRLRTAYESGRSAADGQGPAAGYRDLATAVELLPRALWGAREEMLGVLADHPRLASEAAACALDAGDTTRAVELLERGRAILWMQHTNPRPLREELQEEQPRLARRMDRVYAMLEPRIHTPAGSARSRVVPRDVRMEGLAGDGNPVVRAYHRLNAGLRGGTAGDPPLGDFEQQWEELVRRTRLDAPVLTEPNYETDLKPAADEGPVVYVNVSPWHCDALIARRDRAEPVRLPLPDLTAEDCRDRAERYMAAMTELTGTEREEAVRDVLDWLWRTVAGPVLNALELSSGTSRMWWVPTGPLTTLPLHAAAPQGSADGVSVLDLTVSSYTPTMHRLVTAREARDDPRGAPARHRRLLLVAPDTERLPATARVHARLRSLLPPDGLTVLAGPEACHDRVGAALREHVWAHFDCHAVQDPDDPLQSHLSLHDRPLTVSDLADLPTARAEFGFLAACATAAGGTLVLDEWVSLTAALMYSDFQTVVGTLWPVPDTPTARVARDVYEQLLNGPGQSQLTHTSSALALRNALVAERARRPDHPSAWVSFVHYGI